MTILQSIDLHPLTLGVVGSLVVYLVFSRLTAKPVFHSHLPWVGLGNGFFAMARAKWKSLLHSPELMMEGYFKYNILGKYVMVPTPFGKPEVLVPPSLAQWLAAQPDSVLSSEEIHRDLVQPEYSFLNAQVGRSFSHEAVIRRDLTRHLAGLVENVMDELATGFDELWGTNTEEWKEVNVFETVRKIIARASNRVFVGLPLCRNDEYLDACSALARIVVPSSQVIRLFPNFIRPLAALLVTIPNRIYRNRAFKYVLPIAKDRLARIQAASSNPKQGYVPPNDFITWTIVDAMRRNDAADLDPEVVATRILITNFAAIETSTGNLTNTIYDLLASDPKLGYLDSIAEEARRVLAKNGGKWTKAGLSEMALLDSAIKEDLRLNASTKSLTREVVAPQGIRLEDGLYLPQGARMSAASHGLHRDPSIYPNPNVYDAFRFSRTREELGEQRHKVSSPSTESNGKASVHAPQPATESPTRNADLIKKKSLSTVSTSAIFLSFGHGRHSCPGRFFAANEIKLALTYICMNYELEHLETRPQGTSFAEFNIANMEQMIKVRRRKDSTASK